MKQNNIKDEYVYENAKFSNVSPAEYLKNADFFTPKYSAKTGAGRVYALSCLCISILAIYGVTFNHLFIVFYWIVASISMAILLFRLAGAAFSPEKLNNRQYKPLRIAPIYTIMIALYRESGVVQDLLLALSKIEWPKHCLDIIFLCEENDTPTIKALEANKNICDFRILVLPDGVPKTKPRALQIGLKFAKGQYITIYDAEDRPDPKQLLSAYNAFLNGDEKLAIVQAPLIINNHKESWIAGQFFLEYAMWFRVILPALVRFSDFLPLGGTSNHFKAEVLKEIGGWDAYNLTEDADLGVRLCRYGYKATLISEPTYEEAPPKITAWIKQRSRWIHGHMQTIGVHIRNPIKTFQEMGIRGSFAFIIGIMSGPLSASMRAPFVFLMLFAFFENELRNLSWTMAFIGIAAETTIALTAIRRDGRNKVLNIILSMPLYWLLQLPAFLRATHNIMFKPYVWDKTEHGNAARKN